MIGWYIHHQGQGHLHRAVTLARSLSPDTPVTGFSSRPAPAGWPGEWVQLAPDWEEGPTEAHADAGGALHWAPLGHHGLRERSAQISAWIREAGPELFIADVSVEAALLARLHGVPVVTVALPGDRTDPAHELGYRISEAVLGFWPASAEGILRGPGFLPMPQPDGVGMSGSPGHERGVEAPDGGNAPPRNAPPSRATPSAPSFCALGGLSRFAPQDEAPTAVGPHRGPHVLLLNGRGGGELPPQAERAIAEALPEAEVTVLGGEHWTEDPWPLLQRADVVVTAAGQNAVAEVAASRTPAVVLSHERPHQEQEFMRRTLLRGPWPAVAAPEEQTAPAWGRALREAMALDGTGWESWCDGRAAQRFLAALEEIRLRTGGSR